MKQNVGIQQSLSNRGNKHQRLQIRIIRIAFAGILLLVMHASAFSQEKPFFREHFLNRFLLNPAVAGSNSCTLAHLTDHHQWLDVQNAPMSQTLSVQGNIQTPTNSKHGWGVVLYNDLNGAHQKMGGQLSYAYHVMFDDMNNSYLSFGVSATIYQYGLNESKLNPYNTDPIITGAFQKTIMPNANAGIYYYSNTIFGGISAANLLPQGIVVQEDYLQPEMQPIYSALAGYRFGSDQHGAAFEPSLAFILKDNFEKNINVNARLLLPFMWFGVSYRHNLDSQIEFDAAIRPIIGINLNNFFIAYAHEISLNSLQSVHYGSPFLKLGIRICNNKKSVKGPVSCPAYW